MTRPSAGPLPEALRRAALTRDHHHCVFPGCDASSLEIHHVRWISRGGRDELANLATLCANHHRFVHTQNYDPRYVRWFVQINAAYHRPSGRYPRRITNPNDPDFAAAMRLYQSEIPEEEQDSPRDIRRWLGECHEERKFCAALIDARTSLLAQRDPQAPAAHLPQSRRDLEAHLPVLRRLAKDRAKYERYVYNRILKLEDYLWVHKRRGVVTGVLYYQYYYRHRFAFVSYLVSADPISTPTLLAKSLIRRLRERHPECEAIIGELEDPSAEVVDDPARATARLRLFCKQWGVPILAGAGYRQPKLSLGGRSKEMPLYLVYYPLRRLTRPSLTKTQFGRVLDFIFSNYADAFDTQPSFDIYKRYLDRVRGRILTTSRYPLRLAPWRQGQAQPCGNGPA